jgi:hypothetical protein
MDPALWSKAMNKLEVFTKSSVPPPPRKPYGIRSLDDAVGLYVSNVHVFVRRAKELLAELETLAVEIKQKWPLAPGETIERPSEYPDIAKLAFKRDFLSDSVLMFSAMAVEGFLNYYGVVRLGELEYTRNFARLRLVPKLRILLLFCDGISVDDGDPMIAALSRLAQMRNSLVHPKTKELRGSESRDGPLIPEAAQEAVANMDSFFHEFLVTVPKAEHLIPY